MYAEGTSNAIGSNDSARTLTRQLDYYANKGVTTSSYSGAIKKYGTTANWWWLRSAGSNYATSFFGVSSSGGWYSNNSAYDSYGLAPAFRLG